MAANIPRDLAAAGGVTDVDRVLKIERLDERCKIIGVGVHLVATPGLARSPVTAAIVRDTAISVEAKKHHLVFPGVRAQRPAVAEDHGLSAAPVLVINLRAVADCDRVLRASSASDDRHGVSPFDFSVD